MSSGDLLSLTVGDIIAGAKFHHVIVAIDAESDNLTLYTFETGEYIECHRSDAWASNKLT